LPSGANSNNIIVEIIIQIPYQYHKYSIHKYFTVIPHKSPAIIKPRFQILLFLKKNTFILDGFSFSILSDTHALSAPVKKVSKKALQQNMMANRIKLSVRGMRNNVIADKIYHNNTLNFFPYKSAIAPVGISHTNPTTLLRLEIKAICQKSNPIEKK
jgi:hypothetical protein